MLHRKFYLKFCLNTQSLSLNEEIDGSAMLHSYCMLVCVHLPLQWDFEFTCLHQTKGSALSRI